ncbi:MAG: Fe-S cluster assembly protein SufD [Gammaproteobacteria bacterium TMED78]|nr:MAG: Fe-S cluster assembly protein SufD [Gammaproteobacteria bacterium TMED78]|tara:strand:+ start:19573 stop:20850 length:1278 start_codon:yes stop_codon:yes gene_type:complete
MTLNYIENIFKEEANKNIPLENIKNIKQKAINNFLDQGFPTRKNEKWKYTDLGFLNNRKFIFNPATTEDFTRNELKELNEKVHSKKFGVMLLDGKLTYSNLPKDINVQNISENSTFANNLDLDKIINKIDDHSLTSLNSALSPEILHFNIPKNKNINDPIYFYIASSGINNYCQQPRMILNCEENSVVNLIFRYVSLKNESAWTNSVLQVNQRENSICKLLRIQEQKLNHIHTDSINAQLEKNTSIKIINIDLGGNLVRNNTKVNLNDSESKCNIFAAFLSGANQHIDYHIDVNHNAKNTSSSQEIRGIANYKGVGVIDSKVRVDQNINKATANQSINNLLLSKESEIYTKPELEIYSDDVSCSHGATIGELDDDLLFYLQSRGIDKKQAQSILVNAFINKIINMIDFPSIREYLTDSFSTLLSK